MEKSDLTDFGGKMESSERYQRLDKTLDLLRRHLLLDQLDDSTIALEEETYTRVRAYLVLAHAEIESFIEDRVKDIIIRTMAYAVNCPYICELIILPNL